MNTIKRIIPLKNILDKKSVLLLGPRRTGKSYFITKQIKPNRYINLLEADTFRKFAAHPETLRQIIQNKDKIVAIDEIQKLPILMDEIHSCIENLGVKFLLTGSSARKLNRSHTSLMAGRAKRMYFHPLVSAEMIDFDLNKILLYGTLPSVYLAEDPADELRDYTGMYLKEEIMAEALVRKIDNFSRFIDFAALTNTQLLNFESIGSDAQIPARTIREYYTILEDTLIGSVLKPVKSTTKRKSIATSKFYFFDMGVSNSIIGRKHLVPRSTEFGTLFEQFIYLELKAYTDYFSRDSKIEFWRVNEESEVDFVINQDEVAIEVKNTTFVQEKHLRGIRKFSEKGPCKRKIIVSLDAEPRKIDQIEIIPYTIFLKMLWNSEIF